MVNVIPERLTAFRIYKDGTDDMTGVADIELPSFESMKETVKGAGIAGEYESPTLGHFGSLKITLNWRTVEKNFMQLMKQQAQRLDCRGAFQDYDAGEGIYKTRAVRIVIQGPPISGKLGKYESAGNVGGSTEFEVFYIKITIDGKEYIELDKLNFICRIDGVDYLKEIRNALGI